MISYFNSVRTKLPVKEMTFNEVISFIMDNPNKERIIKARLGSDIVYDRIKLDSPMVTWAGSFNERNYDGLKTLSGYIYFDVDDVIPDDCKTLLQDIPFIKAIWTSFGGSGVGFIVEVENLTVKNFQSTWSAIAEDLSDYVTIDKLADYTRCNILSYDKNIICRDADKYIAVEPPPVSPQRLTSKRSLESDNLDKLIMKSAVRRAENKYGKLVHDNGTQAIATFFILCINNGIQKDFSLDFLIKYVAMNYSPITKRDNKAIEDVCNYCYKRYSNNYGSKREESKKYYESI